MKKVRVGKTFYKCWQRFETAVNFQFFSNTQIVQAAAFWMKFFQMREKAFFQQKRTGDFFVQMDAIS